MRVCIRLMAIRHWIICSFFIMSLTVSTTGCDSDDKDTAEDLEEGLSCDQSLAPVTMGNLLVQNETTQELMLFDDDQFIACVPASNEPHLLQVPTRERANQLKVWASRSPQVGEPLSQWEVARLLVQGLSPLHATLLGVWLHSRAADIAHLRHDDRGLLAADLFETLASAFRELKSSV